MTRWVSILIGVTLWTLTSTGAAHACACCDTALSRELVGWSETGQSVLVNMSDHMSCKDVFALEVWEVGSPQPTSCFDLVHGPDQQITCDQLRSAFELETADGRSGQPRQSQAPSRFPGAVKQLPAKRIHVLAKRTKQKRLDGKEVEDGDIAPIWAISIEIVVAVQHKGKWHIVWDSAKAGAEPIFVKRGRPKVRIFPSPIGKAAVLALSGHDREPGIGHFPTELYWVTLP